MRLWNWKWTFSTLETASCRQKWWKSNATFTKKWFHLSRIQCKWTMLLFLLLIDLQSQETLFKAAVQILLLPVRSTGMSPQQPDLKLWYVTKNRDINLALVGSISTVCIRLERVVMSPKSRRRQMACQFACQAEVSCRRHEYVWPFRVLFHHKINLSVLSQPVYHQD